MRNIEDKKAKDFLRRVGDTLDARATTYPAYSAEAKQVSAVWNVLYSNKHMTPADVAVLMLIVKLVRFSAGNSPDSLIDLVGYAARLEGIGAQAEGVNNGAV